MPLFGMFSSPLWVHCACSCLVVSVLTLLCCRYDVAWSWGLNESAFMYDCMAGVFWSSGLQQERVDNPALPGDRYGRFCPSFELLLQNHMEDFFIPSTSVSP